jgi:hypothetical protein
MMPLLLGISSDATLTAKNLHFFQSLDDATQDSVSRQELKTV